MHSRLQNYTMNYWVESGAPKSKLVMGMPLYGQSFTLTNAKDHGLNAAARDGGTAGVATRAKGFLAYHEVCRHLKAGWTVVQVSVHIICSLLRHRNCNKHTGVIILLIIHYLFCIYQS